MKIEVAKSDLDNALAVAGLALGSASDLSSHYLFRIRDGGVEVLTFDLRLFASAPVICNYEGDDGEAFTLEGWRLDKWVAGVADGVLKFSTGKDGEVTASSTRSKVRFRSLDPAKYPYMDELLKHSTVAGSIDPLSLARALSVSRWFVSADDTSKPELCQVEAVEGVLWATDRRALSSFKIEALPTLGIRIPGKDVPSIVRFLSDKRATDFPVEIKEVERPAADGGGASALFVRPDGSFLGVTRPLSTFPTLNVDRDAPPEVSVNLNVQEFQAAVAVLEAGAPKGHGSVTFSYDPTESVLKVSMPCDAGGENHYPLSGSSVEGADKFDTPFTVDYQYIKGLSTAFNLDVIPLGVTKRNRGGFVSFKSEEGGDGNGTSYFAVIVWRT
jgi:hypothetical protein